jgi:PAS domain S-box-containing protein
MTELETLRARLDEAEEALRAIREARVDAVVVSGESGEQVYSLRGADYAYRQLIEKMTEGAVTLSASGVVLYCNACFANLLRRPLDEVLGSALANHLPGADLAALDALLVRSCVEPSREELRLRTSGGRLVPVYLSGSRLHGEGAELVYGLVFTDLTEQKRHEHIVAEERLARLILEQAAEAIVVCDEAGRVIRASRAAHLLCDGAPLARPFTEVFPLRTAASEVLAQAPGLAGETLQNVDVSVELRGQRLDLILNAGPLLSDQQVLGCVVTLTNITQRRASEAQRELLTTAIEQAGETVVVTNARGDIEYVNPAFELATGYTREEVRGRNPRILKSGAQSEAFYRDLWVTLLAGNTWHGRMVNKRKDGTLFTEKATISPVRDAAGGIVRFVAVKRDITQDLDMEAQLFQSQKMEGIGRLAGGVAHDFNNLLSVILSYTGGAVEELPVGSVLREDLLEVKTAAERAAGLTRQLLAFSRKQVLQPELLDLNAVLAEMEKLLRRLIREDVELVQVRGRDLGLVNADRGQLEQVIMNLAVNARDAMPGGGRLSIETANVELAEGNAALPPGRYVIVSVADSGVGMDEQTAARVFEPFFTTKGLGKGTGLGLSMVYGIVKQSGGVVVVDSVLGKGTTLKVYLPRANATRLAPAAKAPAVPERTTGTETILVAEDEEALRKVVKRILEAAGYKVLTAGDGVEALLTSAQYVGPVHLLLTDVVMPRMGGTALAQELPKTRPGIGLLFMSGYTDDTIGRQGVLDADTNFLGKPFTAVDLTRKVRQVLDAGRVTPSDERLSG